MKIISLVLFCLSISPSSFGQLKRFSYGVLIGKELPATEFNYRCIDGTLQYNFKRTFSIVTGFGLETGKFEIVDTYDIPYPIRDDYSSVQYKSFSVPILFRATFGKRVYLYGQLGFQFNGGMKATGDVHRIYSAPEPEYPDEYFKKTYDMSESSGAGIIFGTGILAPITNNIVLVGEFRNMYRNSYAPKNESELLHMNSFQGSRILVGITYQFNLKKESGYTMTTYYPHFEKNQ